MLRRPASLALALALFACSDAASEPEVPDTDYCADVAAWASDASAYERELLERVNLYREVGASCGATPFEPAPALEMNDALRCAARVHALDMATRDYVMHVSPEGDNYEVRAAAAGYAGTPAGQNLATGLLEPQDVLDVWMSIESSCTNLMNPLATELGTAYLASDDATFGTYWVAVLGQD